jgi:hypothetical protein
MEAARRVLLIAMLALPLIGAPAASAQIQQVAPDVEQLTFKPAAFKALATGPSVVVTGGSLVTFHLDNGARVTFTVRRVTNGRRVGGKCRPGKAKSKAKRCQIITKIPGQMVLVGISGDNEFRFSGRLENAALKVGTYRLLGKAEGLAARSNYTTFKIIK